MTRRLWLAVVISAVLFVLALFLAPVVPYSKSIAIPNAYEPRADAICIPKFNANQTTEHPGNLTQFQDCLNHYLYPPVNLTGRASLAFSMLGVGTPPFPSQVFISAGNYSALVNFDGSRPVSGYEFGYSNVTLNPNNTVEILNASVQRSGFGGTYFTVAVRNIGQSAISRLSVVTFGVPGEGNYSFVSGGITWRYLEATVANCSPYLQPGGTCVFSVTLGNETVASQQLQYSVNVLGFVGDGLFYYAKVFEQASPQLGLNQGWVNLFVSRVDQFRGGPALTENSTLDSFAALRFRTASSQPQVSDYGLASDAASFFGPGGQSAGLEELVMYPGTSAPYVYVTELQGSAPLHWSALINSSFTQFGYFIGSAPYYYIPANCPVQELPAAGINVTQYFQQYGCSTTLEQASWLVVVLGR
jgi:hypothetical protein